MKVTITFQPEDIEALILKELDRKKLKKAEGSEIKFKGVPKAVVVTVEAQEPTTETTSNDSLKENKIIKNETESSINSDSIEDVLKKSQELEETKPLRRRLRAQEYSEFPEDSKVLK